MGLEPEFSCCTKMRVAISIPDGSDTWINLVMTTRDSAIVVPTLKSWSPMQAVGFDVYQIDHDANGQFEINYTRH